MIQGNQQTRAPSNESEQGKYVKCRNSPRNVTDPILDETPVCSNPVYGIPALCATVGRKLLRVEPSDLFCGSRLAGDQHVPGLRYRLSSRRIVT